MSYPGQKVILSPAMYECAKACGFDMDFYTISRPIPVERNEVYQGTNKIAGTPIGVDEPVDGWRGK